MVSIVNRRGHVWYQRLDVGAALRLRDLAGVDVMRLATGNDSMPDVARVVDCLYAILLPALGGITPKRFGKLLRGDMTPEQLCELFVAGVQGFFHVHAPAKKRKSDHRRELTAEELWRELWRAAGAAGVDPTPRTYGEISALAEGRAMATWIQAGMICAAITNSTPGRKGPPASATDFAPEGMYEDLTKANSQPLTADNLSQFAMMMVQ